MCIRDRDKIFPDCYKDFLNIYGEPLKEEREDNNLTVDYGGFRAWFYLNGENSFLQRVEITGKDICLPVSKIRVGDSGRKVEQAYQFSEVVEEDGSRYYLEDCCMLCNAVSYTHLPAHLCDRDGCQGIPDDG